MSQRVIHVGIGVFGRRWCSEFLKSNVADGTIEVVALVDLDRDALEAGRQSLGLPAERCYTDAARAFDEVAADFCTVAVTPAHHEAIIDLALARGLDVLCEKPIADTMEATLRIARNVRRAGRKMAVTMSHRFDQDKTTLRRIVRSGVLGRINAIGMRFQGDMRQRMAWSSLFRHEMADPLLVEGAIHHLDIIGDLAGARCETLFATTWKPDWAEYRGDTDAIVTMAFANGVRAVYEASVSHPVGLNTFYKEYIRVDGERGTAILAHRDVEVFMRQDIWRQQHREGRGQKVALLQQPKWINHWLIEQFARWRDGGPPMETRVEENVQASALVFAAIESSRCGAPVAVQRLVDAG
ncbi:MAG: Gfo/Idh/MocA family oxidoreductase [Burkholderiales bacterium]|nr:Gfo/Idh/MocA family oxidoreductase [Burkholderiales bacterium]